MEIDGNNDRTNGGTSEMEEKAVQGRVTGVIIPPPEIRAVADKTAQFVAKNGKSFEQKILGSNEGKTPKFNFMKIIDPYHAYYEMKIRYSKFIAVLQK
jgi:splicing factor 3A subunit 1